MAEPESFRGRILRESADLMELTRGHPFLVRTADGTIAEEAFRRFTGQNYLRLREFERFLALLSARAPDAIRDRFRVAMFKNHMEIEQYEELAAKLDIHRPRTAMNFECHAAACLLHATATMRPFEEAIAVCYGTDLALYEGWSHVRASMVIPNRWQEFIEIWSGAGLAQWVESLGSIFDELAATDPIPMVLDGMAEGFRTALRYRIRFWDMALSKTDW